MSNWHMESEAALEKLERRWFATFKAASAARAECEALLEAMGKYEDAWNRARVRLAKLESLRDALGEQLAEIDAQPAETASKRRRRSMMSAA